MVENGNGNGQDEGALGILITQEEMKIAFGIAEALGCKERFGQSSPLGGIVVVLKELLSSLEIAAEEIHDLKLAVGILETIVKALQTK